MSFGLQIENPDGNLVFSDQVLTYSRVNASAVTLIESGGKGGIAYSYSTLRPYTFRVGVRAGTVPVVALALDTNRVVALDGSQLMYSSGGMDYYNLYVFSVARDSHTALPTNNPVLPVIDVYAAPSNTPQEDFGCVIRDAAGNIACDLSSRPLYIEQFISIPSNGVGQFALDGTIQNPAVFGSPAAYAREEFTLGGEIYQTWDFGWTLLNGSLYRMPIWTYKFESEGEVNYYQFFAQGSAFIIGR